MKTTKIKELKKSFDMKIIVKCLAYLATADIIILFIVVYNLKKAKYKKRKKLLKSIKQNSNNMICCLNTIK